MRRIRRVDAQGPGGFSEPAGPDVAVDPAHAPSVGSVDGGFVYGAAAVHRYDPDGTLSEVVQVPATQVTACTFGGSDLADLYITTSREGLVEAAEPAAGAMFLWHPGVRGLPVRPYGG